MCKAGRRKTVLTKKTETGYSTRYGQRSKQRKVNRILNVLISAVFLLIIYFGWQLLFNNSSETANEKHNEKAVKEEQIDQEKETEIEIGEKQPEVNKEEEHNEYEHTETEQETEEIQEVIVGDPSSNVIKEVIDPSWQPIGTTQSEPHVTTFNKNSVDWKEMLDAISYATKLEQSEMIVWYIGNGGSNKAIATISTRDQQKYYKVYIEWVEHQGWKPTKVQHLKGRE